MRSAFLLCLIPLLLFSGCERAPSHEKVVGTYYGGISSATETLVLRPDGTMTQEVTMPGGRKLTCTGHWTLQYKAVTLDHYLHHYEEAQVGALREPQEVHGIIYAWSANTLSRDWGTGAYGLRKSTSSHQPPP